MIADGRCQCGCGGRTRFAAQTETRRGWRKGQPVRYLNGHAQRRRSDVCPLHRVNDRTADGRCRLCKRAYDAARSLPVAERRVVRARLREDLTRARGGLRVVVVSAGRVVDGYRRG